MQVTNLEEFEQMFPERKDLVNEVRANMQASNYQHPPKAEFMSAMKSVNHRFKGRYNRLIEYWDQNYPDV